MSVYAAAQFAKQLYAAAVFTVGDFLRLTHEGAQTLPYVPVNSLDECLQRFPGLSENRHAAPGTVVPTWLLRVVGASALSQPSGVVWVCCAGFVLSVSYTTCSTPSQEDLLAGGGFGSNEHAGATWRRLVQCALPHRLATALAHPRSCPLQNLGMHHKCSKCKRACHSMCGWKDPTSDNDNDRVCKTCVPSDPSVGGGTSCANWLPRC